MSRPQLHVLFTIECETAGRVARFGPVDWDVSGRAIDAFSTGVLNGGFLPTIFATPEVVESHAPFLQDAPQHGVEVGVLVNPGTLRDAGFRGLMGSLAPEAQASVCRLVVDRFAGVMGRRPLSVRTSHYSASSATFGVLARAGFMQSSISSPGRLIPKHDARWDGAETSPHHPDTVVRDSSPAPSLLEIPVTTDPEQRADGVAPELRIETGTVTEWHAPLIRAQLARQIESRTRWPVLNFVTTSRQPFFDRAHRVRQTLDALADFLETLDTTFDLIPATPAKLHATIVTTR